MKTYYFIRSVPLLVGVEANSEKEAWELAGHRVDDFMNDAVNEVSRQAHVSEGPTQEGDEYYLEYQGDAIYASEIPTSEEGEQRDEVYPDPDADIAGTSLVGTLRPTIYYPELVAKLGQPHSDGDGYKVDAEWIFRTPAGVATIYNYKSGPNYRAGALTAVNDWHIGGKTEAVVPYILEYVAGL